MFDLLEFAYVLRFPDFHFLWLKIFRFPKCSKAPPSHNVVFCLLESPGRRPLFWTRQILKKQTKHSLHLRKSDESLNLFAVLWAPGERLQSPYRGSIGAPLSTYWALPHLWAAFKLCKHPEHTRSRPRFQDCCIEAL